MSTSSDSPETPATPSGGPGREVRALMRDAATATLGTLDAAGGGAATAGGGGPVPYCSLVLSACDHDGSPILLLSALARHTVNLGANDAVSLPYDGTRGLDDPLTGPRATILGAIAPTTDAGPRARFLARHPSAAQYADFADFSFYRVAVREAHLVAGFGRIISLPGTGVVLPAAAASAIAGAEDDIVGHMNADHGEAIDASARGLAGRRETGWRMAACDPEGIDLCHGNILIRVNFPATATTVEEVRARLVEMAHTARKPDDPRD